MRELSAISIQKNFRYYLIRWEVKNFTLATCQESFVVQSPRFEILVSFITNWKMELETTSNDNDSVLFHLERLDGGPEVVWVNWKIAVTDYTVTSLGPIYECECLFKKNYKHTVDLESVENVVGLLPSDRVDTLLITCQMIVKHETVANISNETIAGGLISLSRDFRRLFSRGKYYDLVLTIDGKKIRAHKSILVQRNVVLGKLISFAAPSNVVTLNGLNLNPEATELIIAYLYTANLHYVLNNPSLALCNCIAFFDVKELQPIFQPKEINMLSKLTSQTVTFMWSLPNFAKRRKRCVRSKILGKSGLDSTWKLCIFPFGRGQRPRSLSMCAETITSPGFQYVCVEFALLNNSNSVLNKIRLRGLAVSGQVIGIDNLCYRSVVLKQALKEGFLRVMFKVWVSKCDQYSSITSQQYDDSTEVCTLPHYMTLSEAMKGMMMDPSYKDVLLKSRGAEVPANKCILVARSKTFSKMLGKFKDRIEVDVDDNTFMILINYIYFGILGHRDNSVLSHLYKIADEFCIPSLKKDCFTLLKSSKRITYDSYC